MSLVSKMIPALLLAGSAQAVPITGLSDLEPMADAELASITGQNGGLFVADTIAPNSLQNPSPDGYSDFTFHRMGLDAKLDFNINIAKLQLGCGGVNDALTPGCDIDIDYLSFMGLNEAGDRPSTDGPESLFEMTRPYLELAIKNDGTSHREIAGIKIGAQRVNGALNMGRFYDSATENLENGGHCAPGASTGAGVLGCNSGLNQISGFLSLEMSAGFRARARIAGFVDTDLNGCFGRLTPAFGRCNANTTPFFVEAGGTRLDVLHAAAARLEVSNIDLGCNFWNWAICLPAQGVANLIVDEGYGQLRLDTRLIHFLAVPDTENFFMSFQREPIAYPNYSKAPPPNDILFDICNPAYGQATDRCNSAYAPAANTGWWLNAPSAKILNVNPPDRINVGNVDLGTVLSLLGPDGQLVIDNPKLGMLPESNCWGGAMFC